MKTKLIILAVWLGLIAWYGYSVYSVQKENAAIQLQRLKAVDQE